MRLDRTSHADAFAFFRLCLGAYLLVHFVYLLPYGPKVFSRRGILPSAAANPTYGLFPNVLNRFDSEAAVYGLLIALAAGSALLLLGVGRRWVALVLWYGWAALYHRNNLIHNPSIAHIGWLLLACAVIPPGEPRLPWSRPPTAWRIPRAIWAAAWALLGLGYTLSGFDKVWTSPSWRNGDAVMLILTSPLARDWLLTRALLGLPPVCLSALSYLTVATELLFGPLVLWSRTRPLAWVAMLGLHLGILLTVDFSELTLGMIVAQLFVVDPRWWNPGQGP